MTGPTQVPNGPASTFDYGALTLFGRLFQAVPLVVTVPCYRSYNPTGRNLRFGLIRFRSPLLTESSFLSFPLGTEMFQFSRFALTGYGFTGQLFRDLGINACLTAPPSFSQPSTPFIAFSRQDIPHAPLIAWSTQFRSRFPFGCPSEPHVCMPCGLRFPSVRMPFSRRHRTEVQRPRPIGVSPDGRGSVENSLSRLIAGQAPRRANDTKHSQRVAPLLSLIELGSALSSPAEADSRRALQMPRCYCQIVKDHASKRVSLS